MPPSEELHHMTARTEDTTAGGLLPGRRAAIGFLLDHLVWFILLVVLLVFSLTIENFLQVGIFLNIARQATFVGVMAVGLAMVIIAGHMDLSIESVMAFSAMLAAYLFGTHGAGLALTLDPPWLVLPVTLALSLLAGAVFGLVNGYLIVRLGINAFIVTLASFIYVRGFVVALTGGRSVYGLPDPLRQVASGTVLGVPILVLLLIAVFVAFFVLLRHTPFGRYLYMIGGNPRAPYRAGINVDRLVMIAFILSGCLAAFAGWLLAARTAGATANLGTGMLFEAFAAVVIGGVSLKGGSGRLTGVFAGVLLLSAIDTAINVMGMPPHYTLVIRGGLVLAAVLLDTLKLEIRRRYL